MSARQKFFLLELNEINFDFVEQYGRQGQLPTLNALIRKHGLNETTSEERYEELEPWIQWVTAHTGLTFAQHGVFRLGDIIEHDYEQIWEWLEQRGITVAATSPMNASNRTKDAAFFVPDPWTDTAVTGNATIKALAYAVSQAVNENATARLTPKSATALARGALRYGRTSSWLRIAMLGAQAASGKSWSRPMILEELLWAVTLHETLAKRPDFVSLFLNAGAHIQHHYMFNAGVYNGPHCNPSWLIDRGADPVLDVYRQYDMIAAQILSNLPQYRLVIATGLHQNPYPFQCYYWRLKDHSAFLKMIGCEDFKVSPRMSRDFVVETGSVANAAAIAKRLAAARCSDGISLFEVDNRGCDLFVMFVYPNDIGNEASVQIGNEHFPGLRQHVAFVALKNGEHDGIGYLIDTDEKASSSRRRVELRNLPSRVAAHFGLSWPDGAPIAQERAA